MSGPRPWWQEAASCQVDPRSFADSDGDGVGDLRGITSHLDDLVDLRVDALWPSPFYRSPMADFGYDISDPTDGRPDLRHPGRLRRDARGGVPAGAAGDRGPRARPHVDRAPVVRHVAVVATDPERGWYVWRDGAPDGGPPSDGPSQRVGAARTFDAPAGQRDPRFVGRRFDEDQDIVVERLGTGLVVGVDLAGSEGVVMRLEDGR